MPRPRPSTTARAIVTAWFALLLPGAPLAAHAALDAPVSPHAQPGVAATMRFFDHLAGRYIVAGQQESVDWFGVNNEAELDFILTNTGQLPGVRGFDFMFMSDSRNNMQRVADRAIEWHRRGGLVTICFHWFVGADQKFYTSETSFDIREAVKAGTPENTEFLAEMDLVAGELTKLRDAGVPVLWRPFHESSGGWFWWGAKGAAAFKDAWRLMFTRYTEVHGLTNLIWVYNPTDPIPTNAPSWYPGDDVVDMISIDKYPAAGTHPTFASDYTALRGFKPGKPRVISENGAIPDIDRLFADGANWGYFCTWNGFQRDAAQNALPFLQSVYAHPKVLTLDELPSLYSIYSQPLLLDRESQAVAPGANLLLTASASGAAPANVSWERNGATIAGATTATLTRTGMTAAEAGLYAATSGSATSAPAIVGLTTTDKVTGFGRALDQNITHPNKNVFDQVLLTGVAEAITADHPLEQITRTSFIDLDNDIVQVEFSGPGTLTLVLDTPTGPATPVNYHQPDVSYMKGHAGLVITGATEKTNVSVFTVGRATAFDPTGTYDIAKAISDTNDPAENGNPLFAGHAASDYDGVADLAFIAIASSNGRFGGVRAANASFFAHHGRTGIYAPGVAFSGPLYVGDVTAFDSAVPVLLVGTVSDARVAGGDLAQDNGAAVQVTGLSQLTFTPGADSHNRPSAAKTNQGVLQQNGRDVTAQIVVNP